MTNLLPQPLAIRGLWAQARTLGSVGRIGDTVGR